MTDIHLLHLMALIFQAQNHLRELYLLIFFLQALLNQLVEPGTFAMGSPVTEPFRGTDETEHMVTLSNGFYLGKYEVTQEQYEAVMAGNTDGINATPSQWTGSPNLPVEYVSWNKIQTFLNRLNNSEQAAGGLPGGWEYVLPTEAEWEYACRAGTTTAYSWGAESNSSKANSVESGFQQTVAVGSLPPTHGGFMTCTEMCPS